MTTKDSAPGGRRTEKVGLPYDPDLFDHMVSHGVVVEVTSCKMLCEPVTPGQSFQSVLAAIAVATRIGRAHIVAG